LSIDADLVNGSDRGYAKELFHKIYPELFANSGGAEVPK
jgi:hypothetical protein